MTGRRRLRMVLVMEGPRRGAVPIDIYRVDGTRMKENKDPATLRAFGSLSCSSLSLYYNPCFPLAYKRESRASH